MDPAGSADLSAMWTTDDWLTTDTNGRVRPWQNLIMADPSDERYVALFDSILRRTGVKLPIFWLWTGWLDAQMDESRVGFEAALSQMKASFASFLAIYDGWRTTYPSLPETPDGIHMGDEPDLLGVKDRQDWLKAGLDLVKSEAGNSTTTYLNMLFASVACDSSFNSTTSPNYCCCNGRDGAAELAGRLGNMQLDWLSTDEYYDVSIADFRATYESRLYPHLRAEQKVLLVPFAAYCELKCDINTSLVPAADTKCLGVAEAHNAWYEADDRVAGFAIYRLKNIWRANAETEDVCLNPAGNGLGLVDRCGINGTGDYAMKQTLQYYQNMTAGSDEYTHTKK